MNKKVAHVLRAQEEATGFQVEGVLDINRAERLWIPKTITYSSSQEDIYISSSQIRRFRPSMETLWVGQHVTTSRWEV